MQPRAASSGLGGYGLGGENTMIHSGICDGGGLIKRLILATGALTLVTSIMGAQESDDTSVPRVPVTEALVAAPGLESPTLDDSATVGAASIDAPSAQELEKRLTALESELPDSGFGRVRRPVSIGIVSDGPIERDDLRPVLRQEIQALLQSAYQVSFPDAWNLEGDWTVSGVQQQIERALSADGLDIVLTVGLMSSTSIARRGPLPKPVIAVTIIDREVMGIPEMDGASGVKNLAYITTPAPLRRDLDAFRSLGPFTKVAILAAQQMLESVPEIPANALKSVEGLGLEISLIPVGASVDDALAALPPDVEAVYVAPLLTLPEAEFDKLAQGLIARKLPSFSLRGVPEVERGLLATLHPAADHVRLARRVALYIQRIVGGEAPETLPVHFPEGEQLTLNMATARAIGFYPTYNTLGDAILLNEDAQESARELTLRGAVEAALTANLDLAVKARAVTGGVQNVASARAHLKPQLGASTTGILLDEDTATPYQPERSWTGSVKLQQLLYDDKAFANLRISKLLQEALEHEYAGLELDITQLAAVAYFNVLRAKTFERVQKNNLQLTRTHLELAEVRQAVGTAGPGEVYRWQSELASSRIEVTQTTAQREAAEIDLNRILHLPQEERVLTREIGVDDELLLPTKDFATRYLNTPWQFALFRDFVVHEGVARAPELARIDQGIEAQQRALLAAKRAYYVPSVGLQAEVKREFAFGGAGAEPGGGLTSLFMPPAEEDTDWSVGIQASLPLYAGGGRKAGRIQAEEKLEELRAQRQAAEEKIEERIRVAAHTAGASYANIANAQARMEAAKKNLGLVQDSYGRGKASVIDLVDAQTAALAAELAATGSVYQFFIDLLELERAMAHFGFMASTEDRAEWLGRIEDYLAEKTESAQ